MMTIILTLLGIWALLWFLAVLMQLPRAAGRLVERGFREPRESPLKKLIDECEQHRRAQQQETHRQDRR